MHGGRHDRHAHTFMTSDEDHKQMPLIKVFFVSAVCVLLTVALPVDSGAMAVVKEQYRNESITLPSGAAIVDGVALRAPQSASWGAEAYQGLYERAGEHTGQCVEWIQRYFKSYYTHPDFRGVAGQIRPNTSDPKVEIGRAHV